MSRLPASLSAKPWPWANCFSLRACKWHNCSGSASPSRCSSASWRVYYAPLPNGSNKPMVRPRHRKGSAKTAAVSERSRLNSTALQPGGGPWDWQANDWYETPVMTLGWICNICNYQIIPKLVSTAHLENSKAGLSTKLSLNLNQKIDSIPNSIPNHFWTWCFCPQKKKQNVFKNGQGTTLCGQMTLQRQLPLGSSSHGAQQHVATGVVQEHLSRCQLSWHFSSKRALFWDDFWYIDSYFGFCGSS